MVSSSGVKTCLRLREKQYWKSPLSPVLRVTWGPVQLSCLIWVFRAVSHTHLGFPHMLLCHTLFCPRDYKLNRSWGRDRKELSQGVPMLHSLQFNKYFGHRIPCTGYKDDRSGPGHSLLCLTVRWETYSSKSLISICSQKLNDKSELRVLWECKRLGSRPTEWRSGMTSCRNRTLDEAKSL